MSNEKLGVVEFGPSSFSIGWFGGIDDVEGEFCLGENSDGDSEHEAATEAVIPLADEVREFGRLVFYTITKARKAKAVANAAIKSLRANRPLEEWEKTALANGWKPPKGWKGNP